MKPRPVAVAFDVIGTVFSLEALRRRFESAGLFVERSISIDEVHHWKPRREVYLHAAKCLGVDPQLLALVATHPWDIHGAGQAGLTTGFVARGSTFPAAMTPPDISADALVDVTAELIGRS